MTAQLVSLNLNLPMRLVLPPELVSGSRNVSQGSLHSNAGASISNMDRDARLLQAFYQSYRNTIISLQSSLKEISPEQIPNPARYNASLKIKCPSTSRLELGYNVKIREEMKQRQFKQVVEAGWTELMRAEYGKIGTVIGLQTANPSIAIVYFQESSQNWTIDARALEILHDDDPCIDVRVHAKTYNNLKVGDYVEIDKDLPNFVIQATQLAHSLPSNGLFELRNELEKILAFTSAGAAIVSISDFESICIHPHLLKRKSKKAKYAPKLHPPKFERGKKYIIRNDIENLIKLPWWNFFHTQILGRLAVIEYFVAEVSAPAMEGSDKLLVVIVNKKYYLISDKYINFEKPVKTENAEKMRRLTEDTPYERSTKFPFMIHDIVQLKLAVAENADQIFKHYGCGTNFSQVLREEYGKVLGYGADGNVAVMFGWPALCRDISTNTTAFVAPNCLQLVQKDLLNDYCNKDDKYENLQVGESVSLLVARHKKFVLEVLEKSLASEDVKAALTSNAQLVAFDDEENMAILKFKNGKIFACPSDYVTVSFQEQEQANETSVVTSAFSVTTSNRLLGGFPVGILDVAVKMVQFYDKELETATIFTGLAMSRDGTPIFNLKIQSKKADLLHSLQAIEKTLKQYPAMSKCYIDLHQRIFCNLRTEENVKDYDILLHIHPFSNTENLDVRARIPKDFNQENSAVAFLRSIEQQPKKISRITHETSEQIKSFESETRVLSKTKENERMLDTSAVADASLQEMENLPEDSFAQSSEDSLVKADVNTDPQDNASAPSGNSHNAPNSGSQLADSESGPITMPQPAQNDIESEDPAIDGVVETTAKLRFNPHTQQISVTGNLGGGDGVPSSHGMNRTVARQDSIIARPESQGTMGGSNVFYNISNVNINGSLICGTQGDVYSVQK